MTKVLVWAEHDNAALKEATLHAVTAGAQLGAVTLLVAGAGVSSVVEAAKQVAGVEAVLVADDAAYGAALAENVAPLIVGLLGDFDALSPLPPRMARTSRRASPRCSM
jgi:electron transfer flavoprotein alpha subunit